MIHLVKDNLLLTVKFEIRVVLILWQNFLFDVNKQCSSTRWTSLINQSNTVQVMERLLVEAAAKDAVSIERYVGFASSGVTMANIGDLLNHAVHLKVLKS